MTASDWWLVALICVCVAGAGLGVGYLWGMRSGLDVAEETMTEAYERIEELREETKALRADEPEIASMRDEVKRLRADLTQQLNNQLGL